MLRYVSTFFFLLSPLILKAQGYFYTEGTVQINAGAAIEIKGNSVINQSISGNGFMVMNGDNPQEMGGTSANMNNLRITNGANVMLTDPTWVNDTLHMTSGVLFLEDNNLYLGDNSFSSGNSGGFVETNGTGFIQRKLDNTPFTFHTGYGIEYFPFTAAEMGTTDTFHLQAWNILPDDGTSTGTPINTHVALLSYSLNDLVAGGNNLNITMNWNDTKNAIDFVQPYAIGIGYNGTNYVELNNCPTNVNNMNPNIISYTNIGNVGTFGIGDSVYLTNIPQAYIVPGDTTICSGSTVTYTAMPAGASAYLWSTTAVTQSINTGTANNYYVSVTDSTGCIYTSDVVTLTVLPSPTTPTISATDTVLSVSAIYTSYQWYLNGNPISGATNPSYGVTSNGTYSVVVTGANGCTATDIYNFTNLGIENSTISFNVFPSNDQLVIQLQGDDAQKVFVYDALGKIVYQHPYITNVIPLQLSHGVYVVRIVGLQKEYVKKVIW